MARLLQTLTSLAFLLALVNTARSQGATTSFTYDFYGDQPSTLTYQGHAHFPLDSTYLRLTKTNVNGNPQPYSVGRVVHSSPVLFHDGDARADFETTIKFIITPDIQNLPPSNGLTFFIAPVGYGIPLQSDGPYFGIFNAKGDTPGVFAVEFDAAIASAPWNPPYRHVGIDIESPRSVNLVRVDDAIVAAEATAIINYVAATKTIRVRVTRGSRSFEVSYVHDLSTILPGQVQVGISASTGRFVELHDVVSWYFTSTLVQTAATDESDGAGIRQIV